MWSCSLLYYLFFLWCRPSNEYRFKFGMYSRIHTMKIWCLIHSLSFQLYFFLFHVFFLTCFRPALLYCFQYCFLLASWLSLVYQELIMNCVSHYLLLSWRRRSHVLYWFTDLWYLGWHLLSDMNLGFSFSSS